MTQTCPSCSQPTEGRFCSHCGAGLEGPRACGACGGSLPEGGRFCNQCGASAEVPLSAASATNQPSAAGRGRSMLPWAITAGALAALLALAIYPRMDRSDDFVATASGPPITGTTAGARGIDLSSMTEREAADRLFNRVMQYVSDEDSVQARQFLPMALAAYQRVEDLDRDGHYHVAVLELVNENPSGARAHADTILAEEPDHLFGLATAAQAEMKMGNEGEGQAFFRRFLEVY
ncbi:MAG: zinc ribbon domain-containing protein, partial [Gemmatimonadetes bacterium]|nr:zinc ribbon domain-containing protein [Gemmatimonadota bacterium]